MPPLLLREHGRYGYSPITRREPFRWPGGKGLAVYLAVNVEHFAFGEGLGAELAPGGGAGDTPDILNYAWRDWGNRVGVWRMLDMLDALRLPCAVLPNSAVYEYAPGVMDAFRERGDEVVGHGRSNAERQGTLDEDDERALIDEATATIARHEPRPPAGWLGPWISESHRTPDLLAEAGYRYLLDWCHDDQPTWFTTRAGGHILSVPYPQELNDIPAVVARKIEGAAFARMILDAFREMLDQARGEALVMGVALHPYITAQPHRLRPLRQALATMQAEGGDAVWWTTPGAVAAHFAAVRPASGGEIGV